MKSASSSSSKPRLVRVLPLTPVTKIPSLSNSYDEACPDFIRLFSSLFSFSNKGKTFLNYTLSAGIAEVLTVRFQRVTGAESLTSHPRMHTDPKCRLGSDLRLLLSPLFRRPLLLGSQSCFPFSATPFVSSQQCREPAPAPPAPEQCG